MDDVESSAEHDNVGVVVGQTKDPKSDDIPPLGELAHRTRVSIVTIKAGVVYVSVVQILKLLIEV